MRTRSSSNLIVESSTTPKRHNRRRSKQRVEPFSLEETFVVTMADQRTMAELLQAPTKGYRDAIVIPAILAENFELKHGLLNLVTSKQFYGFEKEDPHAHIRCRKTFTCPYGTFAYRRMPFGLCNAPGTFQRCMMAIFHDMIEKTMEVFMDDFSVFGDSFDSCLSNLERMLKRCEDTNLVLNWEKCHFMCKEGIVLGHKISKSRIKVDRAKIDVIAKLPHPTTVKGVRSFLGHAGFYRRFIQDFSKISRPITHLLKKETPFVFSQDCINAFETLKKKLTEAPILVVPDWNIPFELMCDASDFAIGAVLGQCKTKHFQPIHYASKTMTKAQIHYTTTEKEMLAMVYAFEKFRPYLILSKSIVYTDKCMDKSKITRKQSKTSKPGPENQKSTRPKPKPKAEPVKRQSTEEEKKRDDSSKTAEGRRKKTLARKRANGKDSEQSKEGAKRHKTEYEKEKEELKAYLDLVPREEFAMEIESLGTNYPIVDWKTHVLTENFMYCQIIIADGGSKNYKIFSEMLDDFDRQDVMDLHRLVEERYATLRPEGYDLMLWGDLKILFQPEEEDEVWMHQWYGYMKSHMKTVKNGQTRTQERKSE
ncbi:reverse transcriptase domain-containing protein [Tanacetum coccineum]